MPTLTLDEAATQLPSDANEQHEIRGSKSLGPRLILAAVAFTVESVAVAALHHPWLRTINIALGPIAFLVSLLFFGRHRLRLRTASGSLGSNRATSMLAAFHLIAVGAVFAVQFSLLHSYYVLHQQPSQVLVAGWYVAGVAMALSLIAMACPFRTLFQIARNLGPAWIGAAASTAFILVARSFGLAEWDAPTSWLGNTLAAASFQQVVGLLRLTTNIPLVTHPDTRILGTPTFLIHLAGRCSGIEGLALTFVLTTGYILLERRSLRLGRAIWLIPAALTLAWCSNILRLAILIVIGNAGHPAVALNGFHSEAGWIAFSAISIGFLVIADHSKFFQKPRAVAVVAGPSVAVAPRSIALPGSPAYRRLDGEITVPYLLPLLVIMATGLFSRAASNGFETLYPLRFVLAAACIYFFRKEYSLIRWNVRALDVILGIAVGALWIAVAPLLTHHANSGVVIANGLAILHPVQRNLWLTFRVLAAITTVPFAEEIAFRGFLARRLTSLEAGRLPYGLMSIPAILLSSAAFAALHGSLWPLGLVAGIVFAFIAYLRNDLGGSIVAHSLANLTIAVWVLSHHNFNLW